LWHITHAMLRWMAPFLSFTAEEAWEVFGMSDSIFLETYAQLPEPDTQLLTKWSRIREIRDAVNKDIETLRAAGQVGASLQAQVHITVNAADHGLLSSLGADLKYVLITSGVTLNLGDALAVQTQVSQDPKCDRCWHYAADVGQHTDHPSLCARCFSSLFGQAHYPSAQERRFA
jgi:isoleucyl-tRNA synthetase